MFNSVIASPMTVTAFLICELSALALGFLASLIFTRREHHSGAFAQTLVLLPPVVALVIMMVNGNIGAGVAVAGAFGLIRFRSAPGSAKEIGLVFLATAVGLATGMGYVAIAAVFFTVIALFLLLLTAVGFGAGAADERELKITIPENLDYDGLFDDLFAKYTRSAELDRVKTANMGTLYELSYKVVLRDSRETKAFLDELRTRNCNLNIVCGKPVTKEAL